MDIPQVNEKVKSLEKKLSEHFDHTISLHVDWDKMQNINKNQYKSIENALSKGLFTENNSLTKWLEQSKRARAIFLEKVSQITLVVASSVQYKIGNSYYQVDYSNVTIFILIRDGYLENCDG